METSKRNVSLYLVIGILIWLNIGILATLFAIKFEEQKVRNFPGKRCLLPVEESLDGKEFIFMKQQLRLTKSQ
jgi:hypothetical protein